CGVQRGILIDPDQRTDQSAGMILRVFECRDRAQNTTCARDDASRAHQTVHVGLGYRPADLGPTFHLHLKEDGFVRCQQSIPRPDAEEPHEIAIEDSSRGLTNQLNGHTILHRASYVEVYHLAARE